MPMIVDPSTRAGASAFSRRWPRIGKGDTAPRAGSRGGGAGPSSRSVRLESRSGSSRAQPEPEAWMTSPVGCGTLWRRLRSSVATNTNLRPSRARTPIRSRAVRRANGRPAASIRRTRPRRAVSTRTPTPVTGRETRRRRATTGIQIARTGTISGKDREVAQMQQGPVHPDAGLRGHLGRDDARTQEPPRPHPPSARALPWRQVRSRRQKGNTP